MKPIYVFDKVADLFWIYPVLPTKYPRTSDNNRQPSMWTPFAYRYMILMYAKESLDEFLMVS